ncbi:hypothetical protein CIB48_g9672 [Xylaria polymorpha]|nr:hypothetical protein CIB48_g9672 [Xylaria polymorpha]
MPKPLDRGHSHFETGWSVRRRALSARATKGEMMRVVETAQDFECPTLCRQDDVTRPFAEVIRRDQPPCLPNIGYERLAMNLQAPMMNIV